MSAESNTVDAPSISMNELIDMAVGTPREVLRMSKIITTIVAGIFLFIGVVFGREVVTIRILGFLGFFASVGFLAMICTYLQRMIELSELPEAQHDVIQNRKKDTDKVEGDDNDENKEDAEIENQPKKER